MQVLISSTSRAAILAATASNGDSRAVAAIPTILEASDSPVREPSRGLRESAEAFAPAASKVIETYTPSARVAQLRELAVKMLAKPLQREIAAGQAEARAIAAAWARLIAVPVADATIAALRQSDRAVFTRMAIGDKVAWIERADVDQLGAIMEAGHARFTGVSPEIWERAEHRYAALNFIRIAGLAADHARTPTIDEPLAVGADMAAAERAADEGLARHKRRSDVTDAVSQAVQGIATVVALVCDMDVRSAFTMLTTGKVPA